MLKLLNKLVDRIWIFDEFCRISVHRAKRRRILNYRKQYCERIHPSASLGDVILFGNVEIGKGSYMNSGQIFGGQNSVVRIGRYCAIGYDVKIKARTHDPFNATQTETRPNNAVEDDIVIGDHVWIGDNVFVDAGVKIGDNAVVGAGAVVVDDVPNNTAVGGVPAKILYRMTKNRKEGVKTKRTGTAALTSDMKAFSMRAQETRQ